MQRVENTLEVVVLGAGGSGKSALSNQFMYSHFMDEYDPTSAIFHPMIPDSYSRGHFTQATCGG